LIGSGTLGEWSLSGVRRLSAMSSAPNLLRRVGTSPTVALSCARRVREQREAGP
jgi:hypothetical protein